MKRFIIEKSDDEFYTSHSGLALIGLIGEQTPVRHSAKRRRLKTVIQELMYLAARMIASGRRLY